MRGRGVAVSGVMALILFTTLGLAGFRSGSEEWFRSLYTMTIIAMLWCALAAKFTRGPGSAFWYGAALFGGSYLILGFGLGPRLATELTDWDDEQLLNGFLLTTPLLKRLFILTAHYSRFDDVGRYGFSIAIGHLLVTWLFAAAGGSTACILESRRLVKTSTRLSQTSNKLGRTGKTAWVLGVLAALLLTATPILRQAKGPYFPEKAFISDRIDYIRVKSQFGRVLESMGEQPLGQRARNNEGVEVYRCLELSVRQHPLCVRVEKSGGLITLHYVVLDGIWPRSSGIRAAEGERQLDASQWQDLVRHVERSKFWSLKPEDDRSRAGASSWLVFEGVRDGRHHVIGVEEPELAEGFDSRDLSFYMAALTGLRIE
jgi:hypothetical protein